MEKKRLGWKHKCRAYNTCTRMTGPHIEDAMHNETFDEVSSRASSFCIPQNFEFILMRAVLCNRTEVPLITPWQVFPLSHRICWLMAELTCSFLGENKVFLVEIKYNLTQYLRKTADPWI